MVLVQLKSLILMLLGKGTLQNYRQFQVLGNLLQEKPFAELIRD